MLSRQNIWFQVALAIVTLLLLWFLGSGRVEAGDVVYQPGSFSYGGKDYIYYYTDSISTSDNSLSLSQYFYVLLYKGSSTGGMFFCSNTSGNIVHNNNYYATNLSDGVHFIGLSYVDMSVYDSSMLNYYTGDYNKLLAAFMAYLSENEFPLPEEVKQPIEAIWLQAQNDNNFSLRMVQGMIEDSVFHAYWGFPAREDLEGYENMPLRVKFAVEDTDTGSVSKFFYPAYLEGFKPTKAIYSVNDYSLEIPLADLGEKLPTNYNIQYVELYPYYFVDDVISQDNLRAGVKSVIRLNYDGTYDNTIEVLPDDSYSEEDADTSILGMLSNFFTNFPQMMKSLFVPEAEDIEKLLVDMNDWFSERFGFIWYPFDLAIQVVSAFTMGEADSVIEIPAVTLNMLGGVKLWDAFSVDFDSMGIFEYVRFFTSTILACNVADLAILKWREWIGGKNA